MIMTSNARALCMRVRGVTCTLSCSYSLFYAARVRQLFLQKYAQFYSSFNPNTQQGISQIFFPAANIHPNCDPAPPGFEPGPVSAMHGPVYFAKHIAWVHVFNEKLSRRVEQGLFRVRSCGIWRC